MAAESTTSLITSAGALGVLSTDTVANLPSGAQLGIGVNLPQIDAATPLIMAPTVCIVTHAPTMFQQFSGFDQTLKALIERHAKEITGIEFGYTMEGQGTPAGHDGQEMMMPTNARRTQVTPTFTFQEVTGNLVWNFFRSWLLMIKNPDTQASQLSPITTGTLAPQLFSAFTMDCLFIQFDPTMRPENIIDAWFICNMWPQETGLLGSKRTIGVSEMPDRTIPFYGIVQHNPNTKAVGVQIATALNLHEVNYQLAAPVETNIESQIQQMGIQQEQATDMQNFVAI